MNKEKVQERITDLKRQKDKIENYKIKPWVYIVLWFIPVLGWIAIIQILISKPIIKYTLVREIDEKIANLELYL
ncbi:MAG: hypothetical protein Q4B43_09990 [Bacteroidota bacterium]|nr:hypothetical protein [Bacteroidota bacterium]